MVRKSYLYKLLKEVEKKEDTETTDEVIEIQEEHECEENANNFFGNNKNKISIEIKTNRENFYEMHIYGKEFYGSSKEEYGKIVFKDCNKNEFNIKLSQEQICEILNVIFDE